jgi:hypothetical protein
MRREKKWVMVGKKKKSIKMRNIKNKDEGKNRVNVLRFFVMSAMSCAKKYSLTKSATGNKTCDKLFNTPAS